MMDVWSTVGFVLLDETFHVALFEKAILSSDFEGLVEFRNILRVQRRLNLSRYEVMLIRQTITERHIESHGPSPIPSPDKDKEIVAIRPGWTGPLPSFPDDIPLCAIIGLASMDITFRTNLYNQTDPDTMKGARQLQALLEHPAGESPTFGLISALEKLGYLNDFLRAQTTTKDDDGKDVLSTMIERLEDFHRTRWVQPENFPCNGGYTDTPGAIFKYFPQSALNRLAIKHPEMLGVLRGFRLPE